MSKWAKFCGFVIRALGWKLDGDVAPVKKMIDRMKSSDEKFHLAFLRSVLTNLCTSERQAIIQSPAN